MTRDEFIMRCSVRFGVSAKGKSAMKSWFDDHETDIDALYSEIDRIVGNGEFTFDMLDQAYEDAEERIAIKTDGERRKTK